MVSGKAEDRRAAAFKRLDEVLRRSQALDATTLSQEPDSIADGENQFYSASGLDEVELVNEALRHQQTIQGLRATNLKLQEQQDRLEDKKKFSARLFWLSVAWLAACVATIWLDAIDVKWPTGNASLQVDFEVSDAVILALIGATTANVLGLLYVVVNHLFPNQNNNK